MNREAKWAIASLLLGIWIIAWLRLHQVSETPTGLEKTELTKGQTPTRQLVGKERQANTAKSTLQQPAQPAPPAGSRKSGAYRTRQELEAAQDNGEIVWSEIGNSGNVIFMVRGFAIEPFPERTLDALELVLKEAADRKHRMAAAAMLYRYGRESGRRVLLAAVRGQGADNDSLNAATSLLLNRDHEALPDVLKLIGGSGWTHAGFMDAIGRWKQPEITATLREKIEERPKFFDFAIPLAWHGNESAVSFLNEALSRKADNGFIRIQLEAGLARLGQFGVDDFLLHIDQVITKARYGEPINRAFEIAGPAIATPALLKQLEQYVGKHEVWMAGMEKQAEMARNNDPDTYKWFPARRPNEMLLASTRILSDWDIKAAIPHLERIIPQVQKLKPDNLLNLQLGLALYKLDPVNWRETLSGAGLRLDLIDRIPEIAKLRPLAPELMPQQKYWISRTAP